MEDQGRKKEGKISKEQKEILLTFMEENLDFARGRLQTVEGRISSNNLWLILSQQLNSCGKEKTVQQWQRTWTDIKIKVKRKVSAMKASRGKTGGGPMADIKISDFDDRVIQILSEEAVFGINTDVSLESEQPHPEENVLNVAGPSGLQSNPAEKVSASAEWVRETEAEERQVKRKRIEVGNVSQSPISDSEFEENIDSPTPRRVSRTSVAATAAKELKSLSEETNKLILQMKNEVCTLSDHMKNLVEQNRNQAVQRERTNFLLERIAKALEGQTAE